MTETLKPKVLVVGGGPGGYVAAIRAGQLGLDVVLVEADRLGGTCLIRGCIPSKALIHAASAFEAMTKARTTGHMGLRLTSAPEIDLAETVLWKDGLVDKLNSGVAGLLKRARVKVIQGWARFTSDKACTVETAKGPVSIVADQVILATGSKAVELPFLPFGGPVISSTEALSLADTPKRLVVVGAGYIGLELGSAFHKLGSDVTIVEAADRILPLYDAELTRPVARWLKGAGVVVHLNAKAAALKIKGDSTVLTVDTEAGALGLPADRVLVTIGRRPNTEGWGLEAIGAAMDGAFVRVDDRCATSVGGVWAIGDLVGEPMLEHKAATQGEMVAEIIAGKRRRFDPVAIAAVCFTEPEIVSAGLSPAEAEAQGLEILTANFPYAANGRALSMDAGEDGGFVRVVALKADHRVLGFQAVGAHVAELSAEFALALEMGAVLEDLAGTIHVHPTLSEAVHEAALRALGQAIHI
jgi:dihydrolipoamide dehydrogenase